MPSVRVGLAIWAVIGPMLAGGVIYLSMLAREEIVVRGAVAAERGVQVAACNARIADVARLIEANVTAGVDTARSAAAEVSPAPSDAVGLAALCRADADCREHAP